MRYLGNKDRLAKYIKPFLIKNLTHTYIEPFVGACGMMSHIEAPKRIGMDVDPYIITLMKAARDGWIPPDSLSEDEYKDLKLQAKNGECSALIAFAGYGGSFGGKWFAGMARGGFNSNGKPRNYVSESKRNLLKIAKNIENVDFLQSDYREMELDMLVPRSVIYCDPPYSTGTQYKIKFDSEEFWDWVRKVSIDHYVYVSEYNAPEDFIPIWSKETVIAIDSNAKTLKKAVEKLFIWSNGLCLK